MAYVDRMDNVYVLDTRMFGFEKYMSAYIVEGKEIALIDTAVPKSMDALRSAIRAHGFSVGDITHIFITHEHPDHNGCVAQLLKENTRATVYVSPPGEKSLTHPADIRRIKLGQFDKKKEISEKFNELGGLLQPAPASRIRHLHDGDVFDLGKGEALEVIFSPGHLPGGITLRERKNKGLFINDLVGNYFPDADAHLILFPMGSDLKKTVESMKKLMNIPAAHLYLGHYGILSNNIKQFMAQTLEKMYQVMDIGVTSMKQNKPELIGPRLLEYVTPYIEKMRQVRGEDVYQYITQLHLPSIMESFTQYCRREFA